MPTRANGTPSPPGGQPNLYLIGFMGVGKSVVGRALARSLRMRFMDSDREIEEAAGKPIASIFAEDGEPAFRALERAFIETGHPAEGVVVSCGGGLPVQPGMSQLLRQKGVVVCLFAHPRTILRRTVGNPKRPLLNVPDPEARIRELLAEREPCYMRAGIGISTEGRGIEEVVRSIVRSYRLAIRSR
jgi:shikimate kinase